MSSSTTRIAFTAGPRVWPGVAEQIGLVPSLILSLMVEREERQGVEKDGRKWIKMPIGNRSKGRKVGLSDRLPFSYTALCLGKRKLEKLGLIDVAKHNEHPFDNTKWYAINFEAMEKLEGLHNGLE